MPVLKVLSVRDRATDSFANPFFVPAIGVAIRSFSDEVNRPDSPLNAHPEDYDLYLVGEFDADAGHLAPCDPRQVAIGKDVKRPPSS